MKITEQNIVSHDGLSYYSTTWCPDNAPVAVILFYMAMATTADDTTNGSKGLSKQKWLFLPSIIAGMDNRKAKEG